MKIKALLIFDLNQIISNANHKVLDIIFSTNITNKKDLYNLFVFYSLCEILSIYENNNGLILFYFENNISTEETFINYKRYIKLLTNKIKFPIINGNLTYKNFCNLLKTNCPEYDEIVNSYYFLSEIFDNIIKIIKSMKLFGIEKEFINDIKKRLKLISINNLQQ